eukprot:7301364-Heterocapsa_arctica.AAC.1
MESHHNSKDPLAERQRVILSVYIYPHPFGSNVGYEDNSTVSSSSNQSRLAQVSNGGLHCNKSGDHGNGPPH